MADFLDGSSESETDFKINNDYAERYNKWRGKEEMQKLKDRYGDVEANGIQSSSSESEEEDLTNVIDKQFLKTLGCLKSNDPRIYNSGEVFFSEPEQPTTTKKKKKERPMFLSDYKRKMLLEKNGVLSDEEDEVRRPLSPTYDQEQKLLRESFQVALDDSDDDNDGLLKKRSQTKREKEKEEQDYLSWLKGEIQETDDADELAKLKTYWQDPNLDSGEAFLRDFILNQKFLDSDEGRSSEHPTYQEIVEDLSDDENELQKQETFEHKYNFRFEEPDTEFIKRYPRTMENSLRRKDDKRKKKREEIRTRKKEEKESKREELNRLKALKRAEILERLESLKEIAGGSTDCFNENDLQGDFDPEEHDKKMQAIFNEDYYAVDEADVQKPEFPPDEELDGENWDNWQGNEGFEGDQEFNMDAEWDGSYTQQESGHSYSFQDEMVNASRRNKRRRRSRFAQALAQKKPVFDPEEKNYEEYLDEYYKLDYEDIIGDQPVRFPYRTVLANDFGLSTEEVLMAKDKELNRWCSLKKTCQYRTDEEEKYDVQAFEKKSLNMKQKLKCLPSLYQEEPEEKEETTQLKDKKKRKRNAHKGKQEEEESAINDDRLRAFGINPKKHKNKLKFGKKMEK